MTINPASFAKIALKSSTTINPSKEKARRKHCETWRQSGLSMSEYCRRNGISVSSLSQWLKNRNDEKLITSGLDDQKTARIVSDKQGLEIILSNGICLRLAEIGDVAKVSQLIRSILSCG